MNQEINFNILHFNVSYSGDQGNSRSETLSVSSVTRSTTGQSLYGSVLGGTDITISGYGFDRSDPENNKVFIGNYPCNVK